MVNVDKGYDYFKEAYAVLEKTGTVGQCIVKSDLPYEQVKAEHGEVLDKMVFMPVIKLHEEGAEEIIDGYLTNMKPAAFELGFDNDGPEVQRLIQRYVRVVPGSLSTVCGLNCVAATMMTVR